MKYRLLICILLFSLNATACSCLYRSRITIQNYNETKAIFIGRFVKSHTIQKKWIVNEYIVTKWYKGENRKERMLVRDAGNVDECGLGQLTINMQYLIYAQEHNGNLYTTSCSNTTFVPTNNASIPDSFWFKGFKFSKTAPTSFIADTQFLNTITPLIKKGGFQRFNYPNGELMGEGTFIDGIPQGLWKYYYHNGKLQETGVYAHGMKDSIWAEYGNIMFGGRDYSLDRLIEYKDNEPTFWEISYFSAPPKKSRETYPQKGTDKWIHKIYHHNGKLHFVMTHGAIRINKKGRRELGYLDGPFKSYYENGILQEEGMHYKGYETGIWKEYDKNGVILKTRKEPSKEEIDMKK